MNLHHMPPHDNEQFEATVMGLIGRIARRLDIIEAEQERIMSNQDDLNARISDLSTVVASLQAALANAAPIDWTAFDALIAELKALVPA